MKRIAIVIIISICPLIICSCQEKVEWTIEFGVPDPEPTEVLEIEKKPDFEVLMTLNGGSPQGGDCWADYFFQFTTNNTVVRVYDLSTKTLVQTIPMTGSLKGFVPNCHCNTVCFGSEYYDVGDLFPLLYVSTGYAYGGYTGALVYRITQHDGSFFITLVQTIRFPIDNSSWTEFVPGDEFAYLCYTSERIIFKIPMPKLKDGDYIISRKDAFETYSFGPQPNWLSTSRNQDRLFYQGKILYITGVPQNGEASAFVLLNLEERIREKIVDFKEIGLRSESESLFVWRGDLYVAFVDKIVKLINFTNTP